jgi:hypothetical protein
MVEDRLHRLALRKVGHHDASAAAGQVSTSSRKTRISKSADGSAGRLEAEPRLYVSKNFAASCGTMGHLGASTPPKCAVNLNPSCQKACAVAQL